MHGAPATAGFKARLLVVVEGSCTSSRVTLHVPLEVANGCQPSVTKLLCLWRDASGLWVCYLPVGVKV